MKSKAINADTKRLNLITWLLNQDDLTIEKLDVFIKTKMEAPPIKRLTEKEFIDRVLIAEDEVKKGLATPFEDFEKEMKNW